MIMSFLRKKFIARILMFGVAVIFVIASVFIYSGVKGSSFGKKDIALKINGDVVTRQQYNNVVRSKIDKARSDYGDNFASMSRNMDFEQQATDELIQQYLLAQQVDAFHINISDREITKSIQESPGSVQIYQALYQQGNAASYLNYLRGNMSMQRLVRMIYDLAVVTDAEVEQEYRKRNEKVKLKYIEFSNNDFRKQVEVTDEQIEKYYEENKEKYRKNDQIDIEYLKIAPKTLEKSIQISDAEIANYYNQHKEDEFTEEEEVKASHILLKVEADVSDEDEAKVKAKAEEVLAKVKAEGADFAELAKEYSDDPGSAKKGGDLGFFKRGRMVPEFETAAFDELQPGQISDLVESRFGFHIIKVEEKKPMHIKLLDEAKQDISKKLAAEEAVRRAKETADDLLYEYIDVFGLEEGLKEASKSEEYKELSLNVNKTGLFSKDDSQIPTIGSSWTYRDLTEKAFELPNGSISDVIEVKNYSGDIQSYFIANVLNKKTAHIPELESVKDDVTDDIKDEEAKRLAFEAVQALLNKRTEDEPLDDLVKKYELPEETTKKEMKVKETRLFTLSPDGYISGIGRCREAMIAAFAMNTGEVRGPFKGGNGSYIIQLVERQDFDPQKFQEDEKERVSIRRSLLQQKKSQIFQSWYEGIKAQAKIVINRTSRL